MTRVTIVVPCFNEERRLDPDAFLAAVRNWPALRLLMVDDGSTDGTLALLERLRDASDGRIDVLALERNGGKAEAVRLGVLHAAQAAPDAFGYLDADLSTPFEELPAFERVLAKRPEIELVMGSRVQLLGREIERKVSRHYLGRVFATCASLTLGVPVYDTQCGAKLFRNSHGTRWAFRRPFVARWPFDVEILARIRPARTAAPALRDPALRLRAAAACMA